MALIDNIKVYKKLVIEIDEPINDIVVAVQEDAMSRYLDVQLYKNGVPFDLTNTKVRIYMDKPDGKNIVNDGEITDPTSGRCQFELTTQSLAACGKLFTQIKVFSQTEEQIVSTQLFEINVTKTLLTNETIESTNEYGSLVILFQDIYEALQIMTAIKNNFGEPGETAGTVPAATFWQMLEAVYNVNSDALKNASVSEVLNRIGESTDEGGTKTLFGRIGKSDDSVEDVTLFGNTNKIIEYEKTNQTDVFDTIRMKKEVVTVSVPSGTGNYTATFDFSKGKKKISAISFYSNTTKTAAGTCTITIDGTEYEYYSALSEESGRFMESLAEEDTKRYLKVTENATTPSNYSVLKTFVENTFSVKMLILKKSTISTTASLIIYYE